MEVSSLFNEVTSLMPLVTLSRSTTITYCKFTWTPCHYFIPLLQKSKLSLLKFCFKFKFLFVLFSVKPENVQLITNITANNTCPGGYWNFTCSVGAANPQVTSYQLLENGITVDTDSSGMWIRTLSNSGEFIYKCLANNTVGSTISANEKKITVASNDFTSL